MTTRVSLPPSCAGSLFLSGSGAAHHPDVKVRLEFSEVDAGPAPFSPPAKVKKYKAIFNSDNPKKAPTLLLRWVQDTLLSGTNVQVSYGSGNNRVFAFYVLLLRELGSSSPFEDAIASYGNTALTEKHWLSYLMGAGIEIPADFKLPTPATGKPTKADPFDDEGDDEGDEDDDMESW